MKQLPLGIYGLCMHLYSFHIHDKQSIRRDRICVPVCINIPQHLQNKDEDISLPLQKGGGKIFMEL